MSSAFPNLRITDLSVTGGNVEWGWSVAGMPESSSVDIVWKLEADGEQVGSFDTNLSYANDPGPTERVETNPHSADSGTVTYTLSGSLTTGNGGGGSATATDTVDYGEPATLSIGYVTDVGDNPNYPADSVEIGFNVGGTGSGDTIQFYVYDGSGTLIHSGNEPAQLSSSPLVLTNIGLDPGETTTVDVEAELEGYGITAEGSGSVSYPEDDTGGGDPDPDPEPSPDPDPEPSPDPDPGDDPEPANVSVSCSLPNDTFSPGDTIEVQLDIENSGGTSAVVEVTGYLGGQAISSLDGTPFSIGAYKTQTYSRFATAPDVSGTQELDVTLDYTVQS